MIAAIYARKSTDQHVVEEQKSVARQVEHARAYAASKGWIVADQHVYIDDGISGAEFSARPGFLRLMNALKPKPGFNVLIMSEESRLGREQIEVSYALKQIIQAGVRVFFYMESRERTLDGPTDKILLSLTAFADELERERSRQRTTDAMVRKARAGHVTGGTCFGYRNVDVVGSDGRRSHVRREIIPEHADVIRRIFRLSAEGVGVKGIAKRLNADRALSPRAQRGRSQTWAPASVREVLHRQLYRGDIVYNTTQKRDRWGRHHQVARPEADWIRVPAPELRIVSDEEWQAAHARLAAARGVYLKATKGLPFGRPPLGNPSPYLLTNLAQCGCCGGPLRSRSRQHGTRRVQFYGCSGYHERGKAVCGNGADVPMAEADGVVLEAVLDDVLDEGLLSEAVDRAVDLVLTDTPEVRAERIEADLGKVEQERRHLANAIAAGGDLVALLEALRARETTKAELEAKLTAARSQKRLRTADAARVRVRLMRLAHDWRKVLSGDAEHARPILTKLLVGRVTFTPAASKHWHVTGSATLTGLFQCDVFPSVWRPHAEPIPAGISFQRQICAA